ncbi:thiamine pyrophosphate-binding protein [Sphingobium fuliginis]|uniref:Thiamine pyrophosphate-requiring enzyme n=2 Tax=Sphingobium TaxID=165695 RepID=A0A292ZNU4_SPHSA|nr:thiamine pyrophosphate-binding protein [Sphingobium fuliginis]GAY24570.1 thiamine pyrophosphate-requiring enzyme [Sphingobium fuliginis]
MTVGTVSEAIVARLAEKGVRFIFGVPGGECNLDFIAAAEKQGMRFILTRTETSAAMMACVTAEITGAPGVAMTTRGPGLAAAANGVAYSDLDRAAMLLIADGYEDDQAYISHQRIDQTAILAPMLRASSNLRNGDPMAEVDRLIDAAMGNPPGPAYLEVAGSFIRRRAEAAPAPRSAPRLPAAHLPAPGPSALAEAKRLVAAARRPILLAGLQARSPDGTAALRAFVAATGCPVLTTYKAKGVVSENAPLGLGLYANGVPEQPLIGSADLIILYGFDPVEGPPQPWRYGAVPTVELTNHAYEHPLFAPTASVVGEIAASIAALHDATDSSGWEPGELARRKEALWAAAQIFGSSGISPAALVRAARQAVPGDSRITIDAGAHMLPVLHMWRCDEPNQSLISRGLSTMGFAIPAAIAASLADPGRTTVAFTGDGGAMMCLGELGTAVQSGAKPVVVLFNDSCLTLIGAKQRRRQLAPAGVDFSHTDFAQVAAGFGWHARRVDEEGGLAGAFADALASGRPALIDVTIDPATYDDQILAIRG